MRKYYKTQVTATNDFEYLRGFLELMKLPKRLVGLQAIELELGTEARAFWENHQDHMPITRSIISKLRG